MPKFVCPKCGKFVYTNEERCMNCGYEFTYCPDCKKVWAGKVNFCPSCGKNTIVGNEVTHSATVTPAGSTAAGESKMEYSDNVAMPDSQGVVGGNAQPQPQPQARAKEPDAAPLRTWEECCPNVKPSFIKKRVVYTVFVIIGFVFFFTYILINALMCFANLNISIALLSILKYVMDSSFIISAIFLVTATLINSITLFKTRSDCVNWLQLQKIDGGRYIKEQIKLHNANSLKGKDKLFHRTVREACCLSKNSGKGLIVSAFVFEIINNIIIFPITLLVFNWLFILLAAMSTNSLTTLTSLLSITNLIYCFIAVDFIISLIISILRMVFNKKVDNWVNDEIVKD